ncbi:hypothetical protein GQX73_g5490 [Xylaria multiplex]|uniref:Uncharacterized protein n=1 Tax=Xylaria multiplex TaxID=323545 RepID=A0A7C8N6Z3_9PEZI|nr:hypothetical protein GQX73_g5490 [Xylaria multiplex]
MANTAASFKTDLSREAIPESPSHDTPAKLSPKKELKTQLGPNANPDKVMDQEEPHTKMLSGNPTATSAARLGGTVLNEGISDALNGTPSVDTKTKAPAATKPASKAAAPVSTARNNTKTSKSPLTAKAPSGKESTKAMGSSTNAKKAVATKTAVAKPAPISLAPSDTGFVKPKPKSPTRPVKLPSSLTTHTAASAQKLGSGNTAPAPRQSLSRASGNAQHLSANPTTHRSPSRNSVVSAGTTTTKALKHKPSNIGRSSRPSLGLPPKQETKNQPATRRESHVDEGFLARMMRPTQSSAKKTSEKAPLTPPRKQSAAPIKKLDVKDAEKNAKKVAAKIQASSTQPKATKDVTKPVVVKEQPTAKEIAPVVAKTESAETVVKEAEVSTDTTDPPAVEDEKVETEPSANDVDVIVTQKEEAEDIIETAKAPTDTVVADTHSEDEPEIAETQNIPEPAISVSSEVDVPESATTFPVANDDPKVEGIEDTIQEPSEQGHQSPSTDPTVVSEPEDIPEIKESTAALTEESNLDSQELVDESAKPSENADEPPKLEETVADAGDTAVEAKTEASTIIDTPTPLDSKTDGIEESTTKDAVAATP